MGSAGLPSPSGTCWEARRTQHTFVCSRLRRVMVHSSDARVGGPLLQTRHDPSCPLLPSRVSRVSLPPARKGRTMTVTPTPVPPGKLTRD